MSYRALFPHFQQTTQLESIKEASLERKYSDSISASASSLPTSTPTCIGCRQRTDSSKSVGTCCRQQDEKSHQLSLQKLSCSLNSSRIGLAGDLTTFPCMNEECIHKHNENMYITRVKLNSNQSQPQKRRLTSTQIANSRPESSNFTASYNNASINSGADCCNNSLTDNNIFSTTPPPPLALTTTVGRCTNERQFSIEQARTCAGDKKCFTTEVPSKLCYGSTLSCCSCCSTLAATAQHSTCRSSSQSAALGDSSARDDTIKVKLENSISDSNCAAAAPIAADEPSDGSLKHSLPDYSSTSMQKYFSTLNKKPSFVALLEQQKQITETSQDQLSDKQELKSDKQESYTLSEYKRKICKYNQVSVASDDYKSSNLSEHDALKDIDQIIHKHLDLVSSAKNPHKSQNSSSGEQEGGWIHLDWRNVARRYSDMPRQHRGRFWWSMRQSCLCHLVFSTLNTLFPILTSFDKYSLPNDLITDLLAGFTLAVMHIPQGMAYGMLSGVEPIYGLYVSFVPVIVMALMSKSYHVSYGTFAVISMLLVNCIESTKLVLTQQHQQAAAALASGVAVAAKNASQLLSSSISSEISELILTNNHQASDPNKQMLRNLLIPQSSTSTATLDARMFQYDSNSTSSQPDKQLGQSLTMLVAGEAGVEFVLPSSIEILTCVCLVTGIIQILLGLARLGILSLMFSDQLVSGFTTASAINVVTSQLASLFDLKHPTVPEGLFKIFRVWYAFGCSLTEGFNQYTALLSLFSFIFLLLIKELVEPLLKRRFKSLTCLPSELALMTILITASWYWQFESVYGIHIVGHVPTGLPSPTIPRLDLAPLIIEDAFTIALVSFAMNFSLASVYARRFKYKLDPNQEMIAVGTSNLVGSFFTCFPCASSLSRSAIQSSLNVKSQICSLFSCSIVLLIVCYFAPILHDLPKAALSCIIIVALKGILVQIKDFYLNWRLSKLDALVWLTTFLSVFIFGITYGLVVGIIASLFMIFFR